MLKFISQVGYFRLLFDANILPLTILAAIICSISLAIGLHRRISAGFSLLFLILFDMQNPYLRIVSNAYLGWFLLLLITHPIRDTSRNLWRRDLTKSFSPSSLFALNVVLGFTYFVSAITKIMSPAWSQGYAVKQILQLPLTREWLAQIQVSDFYSMILGDTIVALEFLILPLLLFKITKKKVHIALITMHVGIIICFDFLQIPLLMIVLHLACLTHESSPEEAL